MNPTIVDKDGDWVKSVGELGMRDPFSGTWYAFNSPVKVSSSVWRDIQLDAGCLVKCDDPTVEPVAEPAAEPEPPAKVPVKPKA